MRRNTESSRFSRIQFARNNHVRLNGTSTIRRFAVSSLAFGFLFVSSLQPLLADPNGGRIVSGSGSISQTSGSSVINQGTDRLIIEWNGFDTSSGESVRFNQPSSSASVLNRIISGKATIFDGSLFANGNVIIVNGAGIHFGPNSRVDVGSLIASTAGISNSNFLNNRLVFDQPGQSDASITNAGQITVRDSGLAALVAPGVENTGLIQAHLGSVILAAGEAHTIDFNGDGLLSFTITEPTKAKPRRRDGSELKALVSNSGRIQADGGSVVLAASQASRILDNAINTTGIVRANSVGVRNGKIVLFGGKQGRVNVAGKVRARGTKKTERGGNIQITGQKVVVADAQIDASGSAGGGNILIGGAYQGGSLDGSSSIGYLQSGDLVSILTGTNAGSAGNNFIPRSEAVFVDATASLNVSATDHGDGGRAILWSDGTTIFNGSILARGGANGGDGGLVETSGTGRLGVGSTANVDALAANGNVGDWLLDPFSVTIEFSGGASLAQIADENDTVSVLSVDPSTLNNAAANVSIFATDSIIFADTVTLFNLGVGIEATAGRIISVDAAVATNDGDIDFTAPTIDVNFDVDAGDATVFFDATTVNLDADIVGTAGIEGTATSVNVLTSFGGAEIQDAVDISGVGGTVSLPAGSFDSFFVDRDNLTIAGAGGATGINVTALDPLKITGSGVTIRDLSIRGNGAAGEVGILIDGNSAPNITGINILNVDLFNLDDGIVAQGDIGDGNASTIDVSISGNSTTDKANFVDFLDSAIDLQDSDNDAVYSIRNIIIRDSEIADGSGDIDTISTGGDAIRINGTGGLSIDQTEISGTVGDGVRIISALRGDTFASISNSVIGTEAARIGGDGIAFEGGILDTATMLLDSATSIFASGRAFNVVNLQSPSTLLIGGATLNGLQGALLIDNRGTAGPDGRLVIGSAAFVGGSGTTVFDILTDPGNAGLLIDFSGANGATITGGTTGIRLLGPGIGLSGNTFGNIAFSGQTGNFITLANGAGGTGTVSVFDGLGVRFNGVLGSSFSGAQLLALESRLSHFPDDNGLGLINITQSLLTGPINALNLLRQPNNPLTINQINAIFQVIGPNALYTFQPGFFEDSARVSLGRNVKFTEDGLTDARTAAITDALEEIARRCALLPEEYRIDCLGKGYTQLATDIPEIADYQPVKEEMARAGRRLQAIALKNLDRSKPERKLPKTPEDTRNYEWASKPVMIDKIVEATKEAVMVIEETQTRLLRSAENSQRRRVHYQRVSRSLGSSRRILRS